KKKKKKNPRWLNDIVLPLESLEHLHVVETMTTFTEPLSCPRRESSFGSNFVEQYYYYQLYASMHLFLATCCGNDPRNSSTNTISIAL
ncbi:MAG: hypothetical protein MJE68_33295, partial [Proteobacteria bacterium]|nr:hypothetical protein [Pseudomonadota bacterium]